MTPRKPTAEARAYAVEDEGVAQARMWLHKSSLGPQSVKMAVAVLISASHRAATIRGQVPGARA